MKTSTALRRAGDISRTRGWCQLVLRDGEGRVCAVGALDAVCKHDASRDIQGFAMLMAVLGESPAVWNDRIERTHNDVLITLDAAYVVALQEEGIEPGDVL